MIRKETPKNKENYLSVNNEQSHILLSMGFHPIYIDNDWLYYDKTEEIQDAYDIIIQY